MQDQWPHWLIRALRFFRAIQFCNCLQNWIAVYVQKPSYLVVFLWTVYIMEYDMRRTIRDMPYRRWHEGLSAGKIYVLKQILRFIPKLIELSSNLPECPLKDFCQLLIYALFVIFLVQLIVERQEIVPVNHNNKNRLISSFTEEECWHFLRFRKPELRELFIRCDFPDTVTCANGVVCPGEHAFCLMLYRITYPLRLLSLQDTFGRDYSQLSRIFKFAVNYMYEKHKDKVHGNIGWYQNRFDIYHRALMKRDRCYRNRGQFRKHPLCSALKRHSRISVDQ